MQTTELYNKSLTPVIYESGLFWKREDLFSILGLNGSKARFIYSTLEKNQELIRNQFNNTVAISNTSGSHSCHTQEICCKHFGFNLINYPSKQDFYNSPYFRFLQNTPDNKYYYYEELLKQVENIPKNLDTLFISAGSCQTIYGIYEGFKVFNNLPNKVLVIGNKPKPELIKNLPISYVNRRKYRYKICQSPFDLDTKHELEAWSFINSTSLKEYLTSNSLFWVTANYNFLRM